MSSDPEGARSSDEFSDLIGDIIGGEIMQTSGVLEDNPRRFDDFKHVLTFGEKFEGDVFFGVLGLNGEFLPVLKRIILLSTKF